MFLSDFPAFKDLMADLCAARDRPATDERVRAYWEALKSYPFPQIRARIRAEIANGTGKWPTPADLRPAPDATVTPAPADVIARFERFVLRRFELTAAQLRGWTWLYRLGDAGSIVGVVVPADGDRAGHRVMLEDLTLEDCT